MSSNFAQAYLKGKKTNKDKTDPHVHFRVEQSQGQYHSSTIHSYYLSWVIAVVYALFFVILLVVELRSSELSYSAWIRLIFFGFPAFSCIGALLLKVPLGLGPMTSILMALRALLYFFGAITILVALFWDIFDTAYKIEDYLKEHHAHKSVVFNIVFASTWSGLLLLFSAAFVDHLVMVLKKCANYFEDVIMTGDEIVIGKLEDGSQSGYPVEPCFYSQSFYCLAAFNKASKMSISAVCGSHRLVAIRHLVTASSAACQLEPKASFRSKDLQIERIPQAKLRPKEGQVSLKFGQNYTDYMMEVDWTKEKGWTTPVIKQTKEISIHPGAKGLHYAVQLFEGLKAFRGIDDKIRMFRPEKNMVRMNRTALRAALPTFDGEELIEIMKRQISLDKDWVPSAEGSALYIRPFIFATDPTLGVLPPEAAKLMVLLSPVGNYFGPTSEDLRLLADCRYVRAWPGGAGQYKMGSNYAPTVSIGSEASKKGCQQVLWLSGKEQWVTEAGTMNLGMIWTNENGERELITPALDMGLVLPGVMRQSVLELVSGWGEFRVTEKDFTLDQVIRGINEGRVEEIFGCGTAVVIVPVGSFLVVDKNENEQLYKLPEKKPEDSVVQRIYREITDIQYGRREMKDWVRIVS